MLSDKKQKRKALFDSKNPCDKTQERQNKLGMAGAVKGT